MATDLTTDTPQPLPTLPAHVDARIKIRWNAEFDRPVGATHTLALEERREAWRVLKAQLAPCGDRYAAAQLAPLFATLVGQNREGIDVKVLAKTMSAELGRLPADLVAKACGEWFVSSKWQPTPADLIALMEPELSTRRVKFDAVGVVGQEAPKAQPAERADPARIDEILRRHGYTPSKPTEQSA